MNDWMNMMGVAGDPGQDAANMGYNQMMQPQPDMAWLEAAQRPASGPEEFKSRLSGWTEIVQKFQTDSNLQRALMMAGAMMMQPIQPGQTAGGNLGNAAVVGMNAYTAGMAADREAMMKKAQEGRAERGLQVQEAESRSRIGEREAKLPLEVEGLRTQNRAGAVAANVAEETQGSKIAQARTEAQKASLELQKMLDNKEVDALERAYNVRKARLLAGVTDLTLRRSIEAELQKPLLEMQLKRQQIAASAAQTRKTGAEAGVAEQELALGARGRAELKNTTTQTRELVQHDLMKKLYAASPTLQRDHPDESKWLADVVTGQKLNAAQMIRAINETLDTAAGVSDEETNSLIELRRSLLGQAASGRQPAAQSAGGNKTATMAEVRETARVHNMSEQQALEILRRSGVRIIDMDQPVPNARNRR